MRCELEENWRERETYAFSTDHLVHRSGRRELVRRVVQRLVAHRHDLEHHEQYLEHIRRSMLPSAQRECHYMRTSNPLPWSGASSGDVPRVASRSNMVVPLPNMRPRLAEMVQVRRI